MRWVSRVLLFARSWIASMVLVTAALFALAPNCCQRSFAAGGNDVNQAESEVSVFDVPFEGWRFGVSMQPIQDQVYLPVGREDETVSIAIVRAFQSMQFSLLSPKLSTESGLNGDEQWQTDVVEIAPTEIEKHNHMFASLHLPDDRIFGLSYQGSFQLRGPTIHFEISAILFHRGSRADFRPYRDGQYAGSFFVEKVKQRIIEQLRDAI